MNKIQKAVVGLGVTVAFGITFVLTALKGVSEAFEWEQDDE